MLTARNVSVGSGAAVSQIFVPMLYVDKGKVVTYAQAGESIHNYGRAIDVVEIKNGVGLWKNRRWNTIGSYGKRFGFEWGGNWKRFKDKPHFQLK